MTKVCPIIERACIDEHCWWFLNGCPAYPGSNPLRIHLREINRLLTEILAVLSYQNPELIVSEPLPAGHKCQFCEKDIESEPDNQGSLVFEGCHMITIVYNETINGNPCFLAADTNLPGCIAQGETEEEALKELKEARIDYKASLQEDGLPLPEVYRESGSVSYIDIVECSFATEGR